MVEGNFLAYDNQFTEDITMIQLADVGLRVEDGGTAIFNDSKLWNNTVGSIVEGALTLDNSTAEGSALGILVEDPGTATIRNASTVRHNTTGLDVRSAAGVTVEGNSTIKFNGTGAIVYDGGTATITDSQIHDNALGLDVRSDDGTTVVGSVITNNGTGVRSGLKQTGPLDGLPSGRSAFTLSESCVTESEYVPGGSNGYGIWARHADVELDRTTIEGNDAYGLFIDDGDVAAYRLLATSNGDEASANGRDGVRVSANGGLSLTAYPGAQSQFTGGGTQAKGSSGIGSSGEAPGLNSIHNSGESEISIEDGGYAYVGDVCSLTDCPASNRVSKAGTLGQNARLIENNSQTDVVSAWRTYWATSPTNPPDVAFEHPSVVEDWQALSADPATTAGAPDGCDSVKRLPTGDGLVSARSSGASAERGLDPETADWLRARLRAMRQALDEGPGTDTAASLVHGLYALQRTDRADVLGEHARTMGALARLRARLAGEGSGNDPLPPALRAAAETALVVTIHDALRHGRYEQARAHLATFGSRVEGESARRTLALAAVALDEQAGDYESALARIGELLAELDPDAQLARDLQATAALLLERLGETGRTAPALLAATAAHGSDATSSGATSTAQGRGAVAEAGIGAKAGTPEAYETALAPAYPNPFGSGAGVRTTVPLTLAAHAEVRLAVYDVLGREVAVLADGALEAGRHEVSFEAGGLPAGVYVVRATVNEGATPGGTRGVVRTFTGRLTLVE